MSNMFSDLQKVKEEQAQTLNNSSPQPVKERKISSERNAQKVAQNIEQMSKGLSKDEHMIPHTWPLSFITGPPLMLPSNRALT